MSPPQIFGLGSPIILFLFVLCPAPMRRLAAPLFALLLVTISLAGCFQDEIVVKINPDGSGTIEQTFLLTRAAVKQMRSMQAQFDPDAPFSVLDKEELREKAAEFGEGVRFVSAVPLETEDGEGYRAVYAFDDVTALDIQPETSEGPTPSFGEDDDEKPGVRFAFEPGSPARLTILVPQEDEAASDAPASADDEPADSAQLANAMDMMGAVLNGLHVRLVVEPQGTITETGAAFHEDGQIVLIDVEGEALLSNVPVLQQLARTEDPSAARRFIAETPGMQVELQERVTVTFE